LPEQAADIDRITAVFINLRYGRVATGEDLRQLKMLVGLFRG